ncbi:MULTISPECIES: hypothetical protein [unclassified Bradyrhizobium]|uniref:hypothetical protein n=1 Tax=Bradyrhizobium sp. 33ap4 TaxID=3061630 RepID=UPI002931E773|nr:hypothetical protein [Bradyrhizobium sp. 33ap4]
MKNEIGTMLRCDLQTICSPSIDGDITILAVEPKRPNSRLRVLRRYPPGWGRGGPIAVPVVTSGSRDRDRPPTPATVRELQSN